MAASAYDVVLGVHVLAVVIAFGAIFAYPIMFALAARHDPRSLPLIHRIETFVDRVLVNGGLLVVVGAGVFLASEGHHWKELFVQWGIGAAIAIGGLVGVVMIPASKKAQRLAERDLVARRESGGVSESGGARAGGASAGGATSAGGGAQPEDGRGQMSAEYRAVTRRLAVVGSLLSVLVVATILVMAIKP
jgi:uncharacterized membrane protein YgcG